MLLLKWSPVKLMWLITRTGGWGGGSEGMGYNKTIIVYLIRIVHTSFVANLFLILEVLKCFLLVDLVVFFVVAAAVAYGTRLFCYPISLI